MADLYTIGVYGWDEGVFLARLRTLPIDVLVDVRQRRGVRGRTYRFGNVSRLQPALTAADISYLHLRELAPTPALRALQSEEDVATGTAKRHRTALSEDFVAAYTQQLSDDEDVLLPLRKILLAGKTPVLLCVEQDPHACHRSVLAERFASEGLADVHHLRP